ncbi:MAG TPA: hypothetical protein PK971_14100, partial [Saprospiraceae bacterium]|nr:hypothetical protein [Saprospiraceae bacterium]
KHGNSVLEKAFFADVAAEKTKAVQSRICRLKPIEKTLDMLLCPGGNEDDHSGALCPRMVVLVSA